MPPRLSFGDVLAQGGEAWETKPSAADEEPEGKEEEKQSLPLYTSTNRKSFVGANENGGLRTSFADILSQGEAWETKPEEPAESVTGGSTRSTATTPPVSPLAAAIERAAQSQGSAEVSLGLGASHVDSSGRSARGGGRRGGRGRAGGRGRGRGGADGTGRGRN